MPEVHGAAAGRGRGGLRLRSGGGRAHGRGVSVRRGRGAGDGDCVIFVERPALHRLTIGIYDLGIPDGGSLGHELPVQGAGAAVGRAEGDLSDTEVAGAATVRAVLEGP